MSSIVDRVRTHAPYAVALVAVAAACLAAALLLGGCSSAPQESAEPEQPAIETVDVALNVTADAGWDGNSTPAIAHILGDGVNVYHAIAAGEEGNAGTSTIALAAGSYKISLISPVNADGSAYQVGEMQEFEVATDAEEAPSVECPLTQIPADQVTDELLRGIVDEVKEAIESGDETLKGDAGQGVLDKLEQNVAANPSVSDETKDEAAKVEEEVDVNGEAASTTPSGGDTVGTGGSAGGSGGGQAAAHEHSWKDHTATRQVWVENWVTVPDYETQTIYGARFYVPTGTPGEYIANGPTYWFENGFTQDDLKAVIANALRNADENGLYNGVYYGNYQNVSKTSTVQVGSHQEDQGWYETETYVDYQYCDCGATR